MRKVGEQMKTELTNIRIKILFILLHNTKKGITAAMIAQALGVSKSTISRALEYFQKEKIVQKEKLQLTMLGDKTVAKYWEQKDSLLAWLTDNVDMNRIEAEEEAIGIVLNTKEKTLDAFISTLEKGKRNCVLCEMDGFCEKCIDYLLDDGEYDISFTIYKESKTKHMQVSMANDGFIHPGLLIVTNGIGIIRLESKKVVRSVPAAKGLFSGRVDDVSYMQNHQYVNAVHEGNIWKVPVSCMKFTYNKGERILMGSAVLKFSCTVGKIHMPESTAVFTITLTI